jgi:hypothetical protein
MANFLRRGGRPSTARAAFALQAWLVLVLLCRADVAPACDANNPQVHSNNHITWCANATFWAQHQADVTPFFDFADQIVPQLTADFGFPVDMNFTIVVNPPNGYASTPTPYGPGVNITGDAFYNEDYGIRGFFGYLLLLHEFVNQWTGLANGGHGGWPTDWWANHRSPFPNAIDSIVLRELGLPALAAVQEKRFSPDGDGPDPQVPMFLDLFRTYGGWPMLQHYFQMIRDDGIHLDFRDPPDFKQQTMFVSGNPSPMLAHYVLAYFNLATQADVRSRFTDAGVGTAPPTWTAPPAFEPYTPNDEAIADIARTHCRLQDADPLQGSVAAARERFALGDVAGASQMVSPAATCSSRCTTECSCDADGDGCVPTYLLPAKAATPTAAAEGGDSEPTSSPMSSLGTDGCGGCTSTSSGGFALAAALWLAGRRWRRRCPSPS